MKPRDQSIDFAGGGLVPFPGSPGEGCARRAIHGRVFLHTCYTPHQAALLSQPANLLAFF